MDQSRHRPERGINQELHVEVRDYVTDSALDTIE